MYQFIRRKLIRKLTSWDSRLVNNPFNGVEHKFIFHEKLQIPFHGELPGRYRTVLRSYGLSLSFFWLGSRVHFHRYGPHLLHKPLRFSWFPFFRYLPSCSIHHQSPISVCYLDNMVSTSGYDLGIANPRRPSFQTGIALAVESSTRREAGRYTKSYCSHEFAIYKSKLRSEIRGCRRKQKELLYIYIPAVNLKLIYYVSFKFRLYRSSQPLPAPQ